MSERCDACGTEVPEGVDRCVSCGLVLGRGDEDLAPLELGTPDRVGALLGFAPNVVAAPGGDDAAVEVAEAVVPRRQPVEPRIVRRRLIVAGVVVLGVAACVVALVRAHRPDDFMTRQEIALERFLDSERLVPVEIPDAFDPDAAVADLARGRSEALHAATATYRSLPSADGLTLHQFFDAFLGRLLGIAPDWSFRLGVHPHPGRMTGIDDTTRIEWLMLLRDAWHALHDWPGAERLSAHDRADRAALLGWAESSLRWRASDDRELLHWMERSIDPVMHLGEIACCPAEDRIAAAESHLALLPAGLRDAVDRLSSPPRALALATARELESADAYLAAYRDQFRSAPAPSVERLDATIARARKAMTECAGRLRSDVARRGTGELGIGPWNVELTLRTRHRLPFDAREVYEHALDELRTAHDDMRRLNAAAYRSSESLLDESGEVEVRALRDAASAWVPTMPADGGLVISAMTKISADRGNVATYLDPGTLGPADAGVVHIALPTARRGGVAGRDDVIRRRHVFAHETYPGHRMEALFRRNACALRRFADDRVFIEGWAVYAEDLLHETGRCTNGPADEWIGASHRAGRAVNAMIDLLVETGAASAEEVLGLLRVCGRPHATIEDVGARQTSTLYALDYLLGYDEIVRLRRSEEKRLGAAFDLRAFHARLLSEGPIPPRLIEAEWAAERR